MKVAVWGVGDNFYNFYKMLTERFEVVALYDNNMNKVGQSINGIKIQPASAYDSVYYDAIVITPNNCEGIVQQLIGLGIDATKIWILIGKKFDYVNNSANYLVDAFYEFHCLSIKMRKYGVQSSHFITDYTNLIHQLPVDGLNITNCTNGEWLIDIEGVSVVLRCRGDIFTFKEIFVNKDYNLIIDRDSVVIDVGMNIGMATLWFAQNPNVKKVYSFEPFPYTYEMAIKNFELNDKLQSKITAYNYGLSDTTCVKKFDYNYEYNRGLTTVGNEQFDGSVLIRLKSAGEEIMNIIKKHTHSDIILKLDCEGAEYSIFEQLLSNGVLSDIKAFIMEWHVNEKIGIHYDKVNWLLDILKQNNYLCISGFKTGTRHYGGGYIYAVCQ